MNKNIKIAKKLINIAKQIVSVYADEQHLQDVYNNQKIDKNKLYELWDKYSDDVSVDIEARLSEGKNNATIISIKRWLYDNGHEDWTSGKKLEALSNYNKKKIEQSGCEIIKDNGDTYLVSFDKIIEKADKKYNEQNSEKIINSSYLSEDKLEQLYLKSKNN